MNKITLHINTIGQLENVTGLQIPDNTKAITQHKGNVISVMMSLKHKQHLYNLWWQAGVHDLFYNSRVTLL